MNFSNNKGNVKHDILLEPLSLIILTQESRFKWKHAITSSMNDIINEKLVPRKMRISITFRKII